VSRLLYTPEELTIGDGAGSLPMFQLGVGDLVNVEPLSCDISALRMKFIVTEHFHY